MYRKIVLVFLITFFAVAGKELDIFFIDVGEGEAILIATPEKEHILVDAGNLITGYSVLKFLKEKSINTLDKLIITHPHPDHMGGVFNVLPYIKVKNKHDNGQSLTTANCSDMYRWYSDIFRTGSYKPLKKGESFTFGDVKFEVLSPEKLTSDWNESSLVIRVKYKKVKILLTADANKKTEKYLLKTYHDLKADLFKVGRHGAEDVLLEDFLEKVNPKYAVISINKGNVRGHPSERVVNMLKNKGIKLYITYRDGTIHFKSDGEKIWKVQGK
ncbi:ComEC/Rec2 family competence protein [Persephonella sp.]